MMLDAPLTPGRSHEMPGSGSAWAVAGHLLGAHRGALGMLLAVAVAVAGSATVAVGLSGGSARAESGDGFAAQTVASSPRRGRR